MKKYIFALMNIAIIIFLLTSCSERIINKDTIIEKDNVVPVDNQKPTTSENGPNDTKDLQENPEKDLSIELSSTFIDELLKLNLKRNPYWENGDPIQTEWTKKWLEFTYKDMILSNVRTKATGFYDKHINDELNLRLEKIFVQFNSDKNIDGLEKNNDNMYITEIYFVLADKRENGEPYHYYLDSISNENLDYISVFEHGLSVLASDSRFNKNLDIEKFNKENTLTEGVNILDRNEIFEGYTIYSIGVEEEKIVFLMGKPYKLTEGGALYHNLKICSYDYEKHLITNSISLEEIEGYNFGYFNKSFYFDNGKKQHFIDFNGKVSMLEQNANVKIYSPDNNFYAYTDEKLSLFVKNTESDEIIITLESTTDEDKITKISQYNAYNNYQWIDNERLIYTMTGYEWSNGFGIVNISTGENIELENSRGKWIHKILNGRLYAGIFGYYGDTFPYMLGYYDLNSISYPYTEVYNAENKREIYESEGDYLEFSRLISSDISKLYIYSFKSEKYEYFIKTLDLNNGEVTKVIRFNLSQYIQPSYIKYSGIFNNKVLVIMDRYNVYLIEL